MKAVRPLPKEFEKLLGEEGAKEFISFLNDAFEDQKVDVIKGVQDSFQKYVTDEISQVRHEVSEVRQEVADLRTDMAGLRTELKTDMAELRTELKTDTAELRAEMKSDIAQLHRAISIQTRWILVALLGGAVLYPVAMEIVHRLLP